MSNSIITRLGAGIVYPNQVALPAVNASRAGEVFIHQGQAWRFTDGTEGWDLPVGTPWPVKGWKELKFRLNINAAGVLNSSTIIVNDTILTPVFAKSSTGTYSISGINDIFNGQNNTDILGYSMNSQNLVAKISPLFNSGAQNFIVELRRFDGTLSDSYSGNSQAIFVIMKQFPPLL